MLSLLKKSFYSLKRLFRAHVLSFQRGTLYWIDFHHSDFNENRSENRLRVLTEEQLLSSCRWTELSEELVVRRIQEGDICYGFVEDGVVCALAWIHKGNCFIRGARLMITSEENTWYCYNIFTEPSQKRKGYYKKLLANLSVLARDERAAGIIQYVVNTNIIPHKVLPAFGYDFLRICNYKVFVFRKLSLFNFSTKEISQSYSCKEPRTHLI